MTDADTLITDIPEPTTSCDGARLGDWRQAVLDAHLLGQPGAVPAALRTSLLAWAGEILDQATGPALGLAIEGLELADQRHLRWAGVPLARAGSLQWGRDLCQAAVATPTWEEPRLLLPSPAQLRTISSLAMKPLRAFIAARLGVRLQGATGIGVTLWTNQALLTNTNDIAVGGFLHGPEKGTRNTVSLEPGGWQLISLT